MALEAWHLDVVEAFRAELANGAGGGGGGGGGGSTAGGEKKKKKSVSVAWDEAQIARRVFALLVGEERRRLGRVARDRRGRGGRGQGREREREREREMEVGEEV